MDELRETLMLIFVGLIMIDVASISGNVRRIAESIKELKHK